MSTPRAAAAPLFARYLAVLGVSARAPELSALREVVGAHVTRVPFENLSKLRFRDEPGMRLPPLDRYLDGIEHHHLGGTCYANNHHMVALLAHLGYDVRLCGADMSRPDAHVVGIVTLDGREYLVDAGYGAPFPEPMPLDLAHDHVVALGGDRWVLEPRGADGRPRLTLRRAGQPRHGYVVNPAPRRIEEFAGVIEASFSDDATFMNALVIARFAPGRSTVLQNLTLVKCEGTSTVLRRTARTCDELPALVQEHFGIAAHLARTALAGIELNRDAWG
jgi:arylamine N-acetyltransferase